MKKHRTTKFQRRRLFLEGLESRAMLAGNVTAAVNGNTLFVTGDNGDNNVVIQQTGADRFTVVGVSGSATTVNGKAEGIVFTGNSVRNFEIDLRGGNDTLGISNDSAYLDDLSAELAAGGGASVTASATTSSALTLRGYANIHGGSGDDAIAVNLVATGAIFVDGNTGSDAVVTEGTTAASLLVITDTANLSTDTSDYVRIRNVNVRGSLIVNTFSGDDVALLTDDTASFILADVGLGATSSTSTDTDILTAARLVSHGDIMLFAGAGDDEVTVTDVDANFFLAVGGIGNDTMGFAYLDVKNASLIGYLGDDAITVDDTINAEDPGNPIVVDDTVNTEVTGLLHIDSGEGDDTVNVNGDAAFNPQLGSLNVWSFGGADTVRVSNLTLSNFAWVDLGAGDDSLAEGNIVAGGDDFVFAGTGDDVVGVTNVTAKYLLSVGASGDDQQSFAGLHLNRSSLIGEAGDDSITLDDTFNALDPGTPIVVDATTATHITGLLHIDTGEGDDTVTINGDSASNVSVGSLDVWTFGGIDTVSIANLAATGQINVDTGEGDDDLTLDTVSTNYELNVFLKGGDDNVTATNVTADSGARARIFGGLGDDTITDLGGNGAEGTEYFLFDVENTL